MKQKLSESTKSGFFSGIDYITLITSIACSIYGLILIYSATYSSLKEGETIGSDVKSTLLSIGLGIVLCLIISNVNYDVISKLWPIILAGCVILMIYTYLFGVAPPARPDARSWIRIGSSFTFQPSELLKIGFIISFSFHLDMVKNNVNKLKTIIPLVLHGVLPVALVILTGDAGSALIFIIMFIGMLFFARINVGYLIAGFCSIIVGFVIAWRTGIFGGLQRERVVALLYPEQYPDTMYQQTNCKIAMGNGGWLGQGFLNGDMTQSGVVPENQNDMILSVAGEEFGFIGAAILVLLLVVLMLRVLNVGLSAKDNVGYLICTGTVAMLFAQVFINIGMALSLLPCIGITLPLFSAGGSSSLCTYMALGMAMSVYRFSKSQTSALFYTA